MIGRRRSQLNIRRPISNILSFLLPLCSQRRTTLSATTTAAQEPCEPDTEDDEEWYADYAEVEGADGHVEFELHDCSVLWWVWRVWLCVPFRLGFGGEVGVTYVRLFGGVSGR